MICLLTMRIQHLPIQDTSIYTTGFDPFGLKTLRLNVCVHVTAYIINKDISLNFNQEHVKFIIVILSILLYL
jgi:hypothetical protein